MAELFVIVSARVFLFCDFHRRNRWVVVVGLCTHSLLVHSSSSFIGCNPIMYLLASFLLDTKSFENHLARKKESGFFTYREFHQFIRKLGARTLLPKHVPGILDWQALEDLRGQDLRQLSSRDFLTRLKLKEDLGAACLSRVQKESSEKKPSAADLEAAVEAIRNDFAAKARGYLVFLLKAFLSDISLNAGIVKGMSSFDPFVLLNLPHDQATYCFSALYRSFSLRGWLADSSETEARDEYIEFLEALRKSYPAMKYTPEVIVDVVSFLKDLPEMRARKHLFHIFRLSCLCLTSNSPELPAVKFPGVDCSDPRCRLFDVIMPAQSYFANVADSVSICTTEASLSTYKDLEARFSSGNVAGDPWAHVDSFGKAGFHKVLTTLHKTLMKNTTPDCASNVGSSASGSGKQRKFSPAKPKKVAFKEISSLEQVQKTGESAPGPSNR